MGVVPTSISVLCVGLTAFKVEAVQIPWQPLTWLAGFNGSGSKITKGSESSESGDLVYFAHLHGSSGSSVCSFAKRVASNATSGVKLAPRQFDKTACNLWDWKKDGQMPRVPLRGCDDVKALAKEERSSWLFVETALDVRPPCDDIVFATTIREPWARILSLLKQNETAPADALEVMRGMRPGDSIISPDSPFTWAGWPPSIYDPVFQTGIFDNFYIRYFLGADEGRQLPWGSINKQHLHRVKQLLRSFDVVAPATQTEEFLMRLSEVASAKGGMMMKDVSDPSDLEISNAHPESASEVFTKSIGKEGLREFEKRFREQNKLDAQLYTWILEQW